ncbi:glu leu phe val dehydrogenase family protein [Fusarium langsethiae]|uniref:Glu leu phe val dehydrogenase family protein n=1 Tax=Fusarium langsethiae TaxID=179993 RepID=A0A0M9EMS8_FUSLA|nr:glu leu phe val dehydrogenase family protein [Fusarium langsethiae]GKU10183.1 unnamed protein product [Fusarium langsethiae]
MSSVATSMPASSTLPLDEESFASASPAGTLTSNLTKAIRDANHGMTHVPPYDVVDGCCTWHWTDKFSEAEGWIVIDSPVPSVSGGGIFLHAGATLDEVRDVTHTMSAKLAVSSQPQICGAKGGIRFPPEDPGASLVLERFVRDNAGVISQYWGTGGDLNTDHAVIDKHARAYCSPGTVTALDALCLSLNHTALASTSSNITALLGESVGDTPWSLSEYSVGYVMAIILKELLVHTKPDLLGRARLVVQGFGCVGSTFAHAVKRLGIGQVVAISSQYGFYVDRTGIDCDAIEYTRQTVVRSGQTMGLDPRSLEAGLTQPQLESRLYTKRRAGASDEEHLADFLGASEGEVFVPCAQRYVLGPKTISALLDGTFYNVPRGARFILAGANNVFSQGETKHEMLGKLDSAAVLMVPEWVSNSGTSNLFMRACSGLALKGYNASSLKACASDSRAFVNAIFTKVGNDAGTRTLWEACENLAVTRKRTGAANLLGVQRMSHLTLTTPNAARAIQTITQVYNARVNQDRSLYQLPGPGDPTLSIVQAPWAAGPADIGLSVHFSVYSLEKARDVLRAENIDFEERALKDGSLELVLGREPAGYPICLRQVPVREVLDHDFSGSDHVLSSIIGSTGQIDHYAAIMPNSARAKRFHEYMMGFTPVRTFTVKAGTTAQSDDGLMHVMTVPFDTSRVVVLTEGLTQDSIFTKLMERHNGPYLHHIALQVDNVDAVFAQVRERGWQTTSEEPSFDLATGLRQFFLKEEETGCTLEFIGRRKDDTGGYGNGTAEFGVGNIVALAQSLNDSCK